MIVLNKSKPARFFRTALAAAFFALLAVIFGSYVRLSEADIGCPTGPACSGRAIAPSETQATVGARNTNHRAWKDVVTRYVAGALGLLLIRLAVQGWALRRRPGQQVVIPVVTLLLVFGLTAASVFTIDLQFKPLVMMTQFLGSLLVLMLLWWIVLREQRLFRSVATTPMVRALRRRALVALLFGLLAITLGGWSMVNYAGPACPDFPTCQGEYLLAADFADGLVRWSDVGLGYDRADLNLSAAAAIQIAHRAAALIALLYLGWLSMHLLRVGIQESVCRYGLLLLVMLSFATALGMMVAVGNLPLYTAVGHSVSAVFLLLTLVTLYNVLRAPRATKL
jgi:cytochrome c oxidase assembly protein subunit 15